MTSFPYRVVTYDLEALERDATLAGPGWEREVPSNYFEDAPHSPVHSKPASANPIPEIPIDSHLPVVIESWELDAPSTTPWLLARASTKKFGSEELVVPAFDPRSHAPTRRSSPSPGMTRRREARGNWIRQGLLALPQRREDHPDDLLRPRRG
jgi:hypothetical protein